MNLRVLNLGAGVQSTTIYLMMLDGEIPPCDVAIFADTQEEPADVYEHLERLKALGGPVIVTVTAGRLGDNLIRGIKGDDGRFVSIPAFLSQGDDGSQTGIGKRHCTADFKVAPIEKEIRRRLDCVGRPLPKGQSVTQVFGLSFDEPKRVAKVKSRFVGRAGWHCEFPLFDEFITRADCLSWLRKRWPHPVSRSACEFCPYREDIEWLAVKANPKSWARAVEIDKALRNPKSVCTRGMESAQYLHRSCVPLDQVVFDPKPPDPQKKLNWSQMDCEGMCGV